MHKVSRTIARRTAWLAGLAAAVLFVVGVFMQDNNPIIRYVWQGSALTGLLAFAVETWLRRLDDRQARQEARRRLTEKGKELLKERLTSLAPQPFYVTQAVMGDNEVEELATELWGALVACGWNGRAGVFMGNPGYPATLTWGVAVFAGDSAAGRAVAPLPNALLAAGIQLNGTFSRSGITNPVPEGTIEIIVGPKPFPWQVRQIGQSGP